MRVGNLGGTVCAVAILVAAELVAAEYRLERQGENWVAFADGRRFAVLSPAESADWKLEAETGADDFIRFRFAPTAGRTGRIRFPEIHLEGDGTALKPSVRSASPPWRRTRDRRCIWPSPSRRAARASSRRG